MTATTDAALLERLLSGDESSFKEIFERHYASLVVTSYQILKDQNISKDAVQEVFLDLWKNRGKLKSNKVLLPYLKRSVINRSINILKSRRHHMSSGEAPLSFAIDKQRNPEGMLQDQELNHTVMIAIDSMPDRCRAIFMLCRMDGFSHKEIAVKLDISVKTIENQMTKALKIVRNALEEYMVISLLIIMAYLRWGNSFFYLLSSYEL